MRFIKLFITFLLTGVMGLALFGFGVDETRLWWAGEQLKGDFSLTVASAKNEPNRFRTDCNLADKLVFESEKDKPIKVVSGYRLRFINDHEYLIEVVCNNAVKGPILIKQSSLPARVKKLGGSGLMVETQPEVEKPQTGLVLIGDRLIAREVGLRGDQLINRLIDQKDWHNVGENSPPTACLGWGYLCCNPASEVGQGTAEDRVLDCSGNCYQKCLSRPVVVYFNSDPVADPTGREVNLVGRQASMSFGFEVTDKDNAIALTTIDFGDGQKYQAKNTKEVVQHTYSCFVSSCSYKATISVNDAAGIVAIQPRMQEIKIVQTGQ